MKLTFDQVAEIKRFIESKGIKQLEVKNEILDHVACAVEDKMSANPSLSLPKAISEVHASFGIFGFLQMEESIQGRVLQQVNKYYYKQLWSFFSTWRIIYPILLGILGWLIIPFLPDADSKIWFGVLGIGVVFYFITIIKIGKLISGESITINATRWRLYSSINGVLLFMYLSSYLALNATVSLSILYAIVFPIGIISCWATVDTIKWGVQEFKIKYQMYETA